MPPRRHRLLYTVIPSLFGLAALHHWYNAPEGFNDPSQNQGIAWVLQGPPDLIDERANQNERHGITTLRYSDRFRVADIMEHTPRQESEESLPANPSRYVYFYFQPEAVTDQAYEIILDAQKLCALQHYVDDISRRYTPLHRTDLIIRAETTSGQELETNYDFAYHTDFLDDNGLGGDESTITLSVSSVLNASIRELKWLIAHELGHKMIQIEKNISAQRSGILLPVSESLTQQRIEEYRADSIALEITRDPHAAINMFGRYNRQAGGPTTIFGRFCENIHDLMIEQTHPRNIDRARRAQKWLQDQPQ